MGLSTDKIKLICEQNIEAEGNCTENPKIIDISNENIRHINKLLGIQPTRYQKEPIL